MTTSTALAAAPQRRAAGTVSVDSALLFLLAVTLAAPQLGVPLNEYFVLSAGSVIGLLFAVQRILRQGLGSLHALALLMLVVFAATAVVRHTLSSYALSLGALALALASLTTPVAGERDMRVLLSGLLFGLRLTIAVVAVSILLQVAGLEGMAGPAASWLINPEMGVFLGYARPTGGFSEPALLAIYLSGAYVALDLLHRAGGYGGRLRGVVLVLIFFTGSLSGIVLILSYLSARLLFALWSSAVRGVSGLALLRALLGMGLLCAAIAFVVFNASSLFEDYAVRLLRSQEDIQTLNLVGSEGSRINAVLALPAYWEAGGLSGVLFGTGYANYQGWLLSEYGDLGEWATFARGQIDSIIVAVLLSTGVVGLAAYLAFLAKAFSGRVLRAEPALMIFVLTINFSLGYLIAGIYWNLLFVLASVARYTVRRRDSHAGRTQGRRP